MEIINTATSTTGTRITRRRALGHLLGAIGLWSVSGCEDDFSSRKKRTLRTENPIRLRIHSTRDASLATTLDPKHFVIHNKAPLALETRRRSIPFQVITPADRLFVRNNLPRPSETILRARDAWSLNIGGVMRPGRITLTQLKQLSKSVTIRMVLQCSGNGRAFFQHGPSGSPWSTGAAGCVSWTGIRVADVFAYFGGVKPSTRYLTATGGESLPENVVRDQVVVERSIPIGKGLKDCILAWSMNGEPVSILHGGPLRLIVPGYFGCNQIKYVQHLAATRVQSTAKIQQTGYRFRSIGERGTANQPSMWRMPVKSWLISAETWAIKDDQYRINFEGVAFSGERGVAAVFFSTNDGARWTQADLKPADTDSVDAWRLFSGSVVLGSGSHRIVTCAIDSAGERQPKDRVENERGYGHNGWEDHGLTMTVGQDLSTTSARSIDVLDAQTQPSLDQKERAYARALFTKKTSPSCGACHTLEDAESGGQVGPNLDELRPTAARVHSAIKNGVGAMPAYEGKLSESEIKQLSKYIETVTRSE